MELELNSGVLIPFIISNALALFILWMSSRNTRVAKGMLGVLFIGAGAFNIYTVFSNPAAYLDFADTAVVKFYQLWIPRLLTDHAPLVISCISAGQLYIGLSMMYNEWRFRIACVGGMLFGLAIAPLGIGSAFPASLVLSFAFLVLLILNLKDSKLNSTVKHV